MTCTGSSKPRNPAAHLRSAGALRTKVVQDKRKRKGRKAKHKGKNK